MRVLVSFEESRYLLTGQPWAQRTGVEVTLCLQCRVYNVVSSLLMLAKYVSVHTLPSPCWGNYDRQPAAYFAVKTHKVLQRRHVIRYTRYQQTIIFTFDFTTMFSLSIIEAQTCSVGQLLSVRVCMDLEIDYCYAGVLLALLKSLTQDA